MGIAPSTRIDSANKKAARGEPMRLLAKQEAD
jgi:hypothetical protein